MSEKFYRSDVVDDINKLEKELGRKLRILDVGGGCFPFSYATHVIDIISFDEYTKIVTCKSYNKLGVWGGGDVQFNKDSWLVHDVNSSKAFPFPDKYFDYCVCTQTLEDLLDPFMVVSEINRIAKAGYIEVPSKEIECTKGIDGFLGNRYAGYNHHLWMFSQIDGKLTIEPKYSFINSYSCFHFSKKYKKIFKDQGKDTVKYFWKNELSLTRIQTGPVDLRKTQKDYIKHIMKKNTFSMMLFDFYMYLRNAKRKDYQC